MYGYMHILFNELLRVPPGCDSQDDEPDSATPTATAAPPSKAAAAPGVSADGLHKRVPHQAE